MSRGPRAGSALGWGLLAVAACDADPKGFVADSAGGTGDTGEATSAPSTPPPPREVVGTQVGSEGFWGCPIDVVTKIEDPQEVWPALGGVPVDIAGERLGDWPLTVTDEVGVGPASATLALADGGLALWVDVADDTVCADYLAVITGGTLTRAGTAGDVVLTVEGVLAVTAAGAGRVIVDAADPVETVSEAWGAPSYPEGTPSVFRVDGALDPVSLTGTASYVDCGAGALNCPTEDRVADLVGAR